MLKPLLVAILSTVSAGALSAEGPETVPGTISYQLPSGALADRDVAIEMSRDASGAATFKLFAGSEVIPSSEAFIRDKRGSRLAYVAFPSAFTAPDGTVSHLLFKGWKLGNDSRMLYHGTAFKVTDDELAASGKTLSECIDGIRRTGEIDDKWSFAGAFRFEKR